MNNLIEIVVRDVYGVPTVYPVNEQAKRLAAIAGTKTLTQAALQHAEAMGFLIQNVSRPASWISVRGMVPA